MSDPLTTFTVTYRTTAHTVSLPPTTPFSSLQSHIHELTHVPPENQKWLFKGKKARVDDEDSMECMGIREGTRVSLLGATQGEIGEMRGVEEEKRRKERVLSERAKKAPVKVRSTGPSTFSSLSNQYTFHRIILHPRLPHSVSALNLLNRLASDPAVLHTMAAHRLSVGTLTELAPHESPELLGLNENQGQVVSLRVRTDLYDGVRLYSEVRRVLCHELAHNVHSGHGNDFKELNSRLNRDVAEHEQGVKAGTHHLSSLGTSEHYEPSLELEAQVEAESHRHVLGGGPLGTDDSPVERRRRVLEATMARLKKEEEEIVGHCGTSKS